MSALLVPTVAVDPQSGGQKNILTTLLSLMGALKQVCVCVCLCVCKKGIPMGGHEPSQLVNQRKK